MTPQNDAMAYLEGTEGTADGRVGPGIQELLQGEVNLAAWMPAGLHSCEEGWAFVGLIVAGGTPVLLIHAVRGGGSSFLYA